MWVITVAPNNRTHSHHAEILESLPVFFQFSEVVLPLKNTKLVDNS